MKHCFLILFLFIFLPLMPCRAEEYLIKRGETCLQIAIDHDLTMEQVQKLNPGVDLEMMRIGDKLILPDEGVSFEDFLSAQYAQFLRVDNDSCTITADGAALCFFYAENISASPLFDLHYGVLVRGKNGFSARAEGDSPLMELLPGERFPLALSVPGDFDEVDSVEVSVLNLTHSDQLQVSFRIPDTGYSKKISFSPDHVSASAVIEFMAESMTAWQDKKINVLAAAFDPDGRLIAVRSLFTDFYPRLEITAYSNCEWIETVQLRLEAY